MVKYSTEINLKTNIFNQFFNTEDKQIDSKYTTSNYFRSFPIFGITAKTPFKIKNLKNDFIYTPQLELVLAPSMSNSNKLSNEDSSINSYTIENNSNLNRYAVTDKLDN